MSLHGETGILQSLRFTGQCFVIIDQAVDVIQMLAELSLHLPADLSPQSCKVKAQPQKKS